MAIFLLIAHKVPCWRNTLRISTSIGRQSERLTAEKELTVAFCLVTISRPILFYFCCEIFKNDALSVVPLIETSWQIRCNLQLHRHLSLCTGHE